MGKKQHQKDKMYITYTEHMTLFGGKKVSLASGQLCLSIKKIYFNIYRLTIPKMNTSSLRDYRLITAA